MANTNPTDRRLSDPNPFAYGDAVAQSAVLYNRRSLVA